MTSKSRGRPRLQWTPEIDAMIGTMVDAELAELIGVSTTSVRSRRLALGIPPYRLHPSSDYHGIFVEFTRNPSYADIARKYRVSRQRIYRIVTEYRKMLREGRSLK